MERDVCPFYVLSNECLNLLYERMPVDKDEFSDIPVVVACERARDRCVTQAAWLIAKSPESVRAIVDDRGNLPVHMVTTFNHMGYSLCILKLLVEAFPDSLLEKTDSLLKKKRWWLSPVTFTSMTDGRNSSYCLKLFPSQRAGRIAQDSYSCTWRVLAPPRHFMWSTF